VKRPLPEHGERAFLFRRVKVKAPVDLRGFAVEGLFGLTLVEVVRFVKWGAARRGLKPFAG
jgi:hypothetical protein